jgi:beta-lactamase class A
MLDRTTIIWRVAVPLLSLAVGGTAGYLARDVRTPPARSSSLIEKREGGYRYINPLLECEGGAGSLQSEELRSFRSRVEASLRDRVRYPGVESAAVYFRELNDGIWFSIGDTERFTPASLRKVPLMIAVFKQAERDPAFLGRKVRFLLAKDHNAQQTFKPSAVMTRGSEYTVADLVRRMIVYSDNNAFMLLSGIVDARVLRSTYEGLNMRSPDAIGKDDYLSIQTYASFFRILFNASYLGKELSERALALLGQVEFRAGIVGGVPNGVPVAHKFGEHRDDAAGKVQLHDCGIVYYPQRPYLLCVMTRGQSFDSLDEAIASLSRIIYTEVNSQDRRGR